MASLVYAVFADAVTAAQATVELNRHSPGHPAFGVQTHTRAPLDGDDLPESATEIGRNTIVAVIAGAVVGLALGLGLGLAGAIMGLTPGIGAMLGLITGVLSGLLGGMMAGTRLPKAALRDAAQKLEIGHVLLTIEVGDATHVDLVEDILVEHGATLVEHC